MLVPMNGSDFDAKCSSMTEGLKIHIHSAEEFPRVKKFFYHIPFDHDVRLMIRPNMIWTEESLIKDYNKKQRKCMSEEEQSLVFFKKYSQSNCHFEAFVLEALKICKCSLFWMPRLNETKVCNVWEEFKCVENVESSIYDTNLTNKCLPVCTGITYDADMSISKMDTNALEYFIPDGFKAVRVVISFKNEQYLSLVRSQVYGKTDFIAGCGGILSLFMGISIISIVEIIYSATLRLCCDLRKRNAERKQLEALEQLENGDFGQKVNDNSV